VEGLLKEGFRVRVIDDFSSGTLENLKAVREQIELITSDIRDQKALANAISGTDLVFHLAGLASVPLSQEDPFLCLSINGEGTLRVFDLAQKLGVKKVVYASTSAIYGDLPAPHTETLAPHPNTPYAALKLLGENFALFYQEQKGLNTVILRYFNVYGPRQSVDGPDSGVIPLFLAALKKKASPIILGSGEQTRDFVHVKDVVRATILAGTTPGATGVYNVATGVPVSINHLVDLLKELEPLCPPPLKGEPRPGDPLYSYGTVERARKFLDFQAEIPLKEGLTRLLETSP
jgi:UDP-glucose 4-epimerase